jgi:regulator of sigma E protease
MSHSIFDLAQIVAQNIWLYGGAFLLVLSILVFIHEWGHYIVAKMCGVKVESFSIGFGKELLGWTDRAGTRWKISLIPLGGYVKMFGDADPASAGKTENVADQATQTVRVMSETERKEAFFSQSVAKRMAIVFAGPAINFIFAVVVLAGLYVLYGQPVTPSLGAAVIVGSAADEAGFQPHDEVVSIDGRAIRRFEDIRTEVMIGLDGRAALVRRRQTFEQIVQNEVMPEALKSDT